MQKTDDKIRDALQRELEKYKSDKNSFKNYVQSMTDLNSWLQGIGSK